MSKDLEAPEYASQVPYAPVDWSDRDTLTGRICNILEAVMPEGNQLEKTKDLVKELTKQYWINLFNDQFDSLTPNQITGFTYIRAEYSKAIWAKALEMNAVTEAQSTNQ